MEEIEFYLTSETSWFKDLALNLSRAFITPVEVNNNLLSIPNQIGTGMMSCNELEPGFGLLKIAASFNDALKFYRPPIKSNDYLVIHFNLSESKVWLKDNQHKMTDIGTNWRSAIFYSTTAQYSEVIPTPNKELRSVIFIIHRSWIIKNLKNYLSASSRIQHFIDNKSFQGFMDIDIDEIAIADEILTNPVSTDWNVLYQKGLCLKLIVYFLQTIDSKVMVLHKVDFSGVSRIIHTMETLQANLEQIWPTIDALATSCSMSKSKFVRLFKKIYQQNYNEFYKELRMQKAAILLEQGFSVATAANKVGFKNLSHFAVQFKDYFKIEPRYYKKR